MGDAEEPRPGWQYWLYRYERNKPDVLSWLPVRELSKTDYEEAGRALKEIHQFLLGPDAFLDLALRDLEQRVVWLAFELRDTNRMRDLASWLPELELRVVQVSAGLRMYEEYAYARAERLWGKTAPEYRATETTFHELYDNCFEYRVIYYLRNALVHGARNLWSMRAAARLNPGASATADVHLELNRQTFGGTKVKAEVRRQVLALPADPDLLPMCRLSVEAVRRSSRQLQRLLHPELNDSVDVLWPYFVEIARAGGGGPHFHQHIQGQPTSGISMLGMTESIYKTVLAEARERELPESGVPAETGHA